MQQWNTFFNQLEMLAATGIEGISFRSETVELLSDEGFEGVKLARRQQPKKK